MSTKLTVVKLCYNLLSLRVFEDFSFPASLHFLIGVKRCAVDSNISLFPPSICHIPCVRVCLPLRGAPYVLGRPTFLCVPFYALARSEVLCVTVSHATHPFPVPLSLHALFCGCLCAGFVPPYPY